MARLTVTAALLLIALVPIIASVSPERASASRDSRLPVAMAQPLASVGTGRIVAVPPTNGSTATLPESAMLVLVGSALIGLGALVRRTT